MQSDGHNQGQGAFAPSDAARYLSVGRSTLYELVRLREISVIKIGRRTIIARSELDRFIAARSVAKKQGPRRRAASFADPLEQKK